MASYSSMAKKKYDAFNHASHNLDAHKYIKASNDYDDWQITTAFYSALKFFEGCLFPDTYLFPGKENQEELKEFQTYNEYKGFFGRFCQGTPHDSMKRFVKNNTTTEIWNCYNDLYDLSHNSRYKNYVIEPEELQIAFDSLESIRLYCIENQK